jgi:VanZ family protein
MRPPWTVRAAWAWGLLILVVTLLPAQAVPGGGFLGRYHLDKVVHAVLFGVFIVLVAKALRGSGKRHPLTSALLVALGYGILTELLQEWAGQGRSGEVGDVVADGVGALLGAAWLRWGPVKATQWTDRP